MRFNLDVSKAVQEQTNDNIWDGVDESSFEDEETVVHVPAPKLVPTAEQVIAQHIVKDNQRVKLNAYAGCSKTTTLSMVAQDLCAPSLYLAYNKSMAVEAKEKFPAWVQVSTTHAKAYAVFGRQLQAKLKRPKGAYQNVCGTGGEIARYFGIKSIVLASGKRITEAGIGLAIRETVNVFEYSADDRIGTQHISNVAIKKLKRDDIDQFEFMNYRSGVMKAAQQLWELRKNTRSNVLATHDTYLKLYQLSKPDLSNFDIIYLDEGQDTNECVLDIIISQDKPKIVVVGDEFQQIYQWRGSVNAMGKLPFVEGKLSQSFRFGQPVADIANLILSQNGVETNIRGWEQCESSVHNYLPEDFTGCYTMLYRTNMNLVLDAVELLAQGKKVNLEIDVSDFVKLLESAVELLRNNMKGVKHEELLPYENWAAFAEEVAGTGGELGRIFTIIDGGQHYEVLGMLSMQRNVENPDMILTTAHKSKGREWDVVVLADDFPSNWDPKTGAWIGLTEAERNLLYVAATRARKMLIVNGTIMELQGRVETAKMSEIQ